MIPDPVGKRERSARPDADPSTHAAPAERPPALLALLGLCGIGQRCGKANGGAEVFFFFFSFAPVLQKTFRVVMCPCSQALDRLPHARPILITAIVLHLHLNLYLVRMVTGYLRGGYLPNVRAGLNALKVVTVLRVR